MNSSLSARGSGASTLIDGVQIIPLRRIPDERGTILHMLKSTDSHFSQFGEIYFSTVYAGAVKGWHLHEEMTLHYACIHGRIKLVVFDDREGSATRGAIIERFLGPDDYSLVIIAPNLWNGFKGMAPESIVANCASHPHIPGQPKSKRIAPHAKSIPYSWDRRDE